MENTIGKIVKIEKSAKDMIADAQLQKEQMPAKVAEELSDFRNKEFEDARVQLENEKAKAKATYDDAIKKAEKSKDQDVERLKKAFEENSDKWADKLFEACIKSCCDK